MLRSLAFSLTAALALVPAAAGAQNSVPPAEGATTVTIIGQGAVSRPPDSATLSVSVQSSDDLAANATARNNAVVAALGSALAPLHVTSAQIKTTYYNVSYNPRPPEMRPAMQPFPQQQRYGYVVNRQLSISLASVADAGAAIDAAVRAGATGIGGVQWGLRDRSAANEAALTAAFADAAAQAKIVAAATRLRIVGIKEIHLGQGYAGPPVRMMAAMQGAPTEIAPNDVDVHATATVTYLLRP